jgi:hypothetical protein
MTSLLIVSIVLFFSICIFKLTRQREDKNGVPYRLPPGPKGWPLLGNTFQMPSKNQEPVLTELTRTYGEMCFTVKLSDGRFTVKLGGSTWVYLNSSRVIRELLDHRGGIYCSKPHTPYLSETLSGGLRMALMEYGPQWRKIRKAMGMFTSMTEVKKFSKEMESESTVMMHEYLHDPENYFQHHARFANSVVMTVGFGRRTAKGDKLVVHPLTVRPNGRI